MNSDSYRLNSPKVISQTIDGETVVVNLDSGCYYSLDESASALLGFLSRGLTAEETAARISSGTSEGSAKAETPSPGEIERQVRLFLARLLDEGILVERSGYDSVGGNPPGSDSVGGSPPGSDSTGGRPSGPDSSASSPLDSGRPGFELPVMTKYSDMQELLLLDPVHEVTDSGWPSKKQREQ